MSSPGPAPQPTEAVLVIHSGAVEPDAKLATKGVVKGPPGCGEMQGNHIQYVRLESF